jgi:hypothetical protein
MIFFIIFIIVFIISLLWANAIDNMPKDYEGKDFLDWDDDKVNSEGDF